MITKEDAFKNLKYFDNKIDKLLANAEVIFDTQAIPGEGMVEFLRRQRVAIRKEQLVTAANYLCSPSKFKEILNTYQWDWSDELNYVYNESDHILKYSDLVEQEDAFSYLIASNELRMIAICVDPNNFKFIKERPSMSLGHPLDSIFEEVDKCNSPLRHKESELNWKLLDKYFYDDQAIYFVIEQLFKNKEIRSSKEIIYKVFTKIFRNKEWKDDCISTLSKEFLDDENFLLDLARILRVCDDLPYHYASNRIKKEKGIAMRACSISGHYISQFDEEFLKDRDVAIVAVSRSPNAFNLLDKTLQDDELLIKLSKT